MINELFVVSVKFNKFTLRDTRATVATATAAAVEEYVG